MFKPSKLRAYLLRARDLGLSPEDILAGSGKSWTDIETLQPLDLDTMAHLFDFVGRRTPVDFAIKCGHASKVRDFGIVGFSMMSLPTLRAAFEHWNRYCLVAGHPLVTTITESADEWRMHFEPRRIMSTAALRFCLEASLSALEVVIEELTGEPAGTLRIDMPFDAPPSTDHYAILGTRAIRFNAKAATYYGRRGDLDRAIPAQDEDISDMLHGQCANLLAVMTHSRSLGEQLEDLLQSSIGAMPSLDDMAEKLGFSRRSLQRELKSQGINYQSLLKQYRMRHAMTLLAEDRVNVKSIAFMLGFKDVGSFRRAFQDWTGQSIGEWQASHDRHNVSGLSHASVEDRVLHVA